MGSVSALPPPLHQAEPQQVEQPSPPYRPDRQDYPALLLYYLERSLQMALEDVAASELLNEESYDHARHLLEMTLTTPAFWPPVRDLLLALAPKLEQAGLRDQWMVYLEGGWQQSQRYQDPHAAAELAWQLGLLYRLRSTFDQAQRWLAKAEQDFFALGDQAGRARSLNQLAYLAWQQNHYPAAIDYAEQALSLTAENDPERAMSLSALGLVAIAHSQWKAAEAYHLDALHIRLSHRDQRRIAWSLQNLGYALRGQERYAEAKAHYERAITILEAIRDPVNAAVAQMNLGIVHALSGDPIAALAHYAKAERSFRRHHDLLNLAKVSTNLALGYLQQQAWSQAEDYFLAAMQLYEDLGDLSWRLNAQDGLGQVYLQQGRFADALAVLEPALAALEQIQDSPLAEYLTTTLQTHIQAAKAGE
jgi:tetratricopeptide (TPR) repeat protein